MYIILTVWITIHITICMSNTTSFSNIFVIETHRVQGGAYSGRQKCSQNTQDREPKGTHLTRPRRPSALACQEVAMRNYDLNCNEAAVAETNYTNAIQKVLGKAEAFEKHVKTVTLRVDSLLTKESDFVQTILERHEDAQNHLNALSEQLSTAVPAAVHAPAFARTKLHGYSISAVFLFQ